MAEGLGLAASVIAVADLTGKTIALSVKLKSLWEEVKDVPVTLLEKAEHLQYLDELLCEAEKDAADSSMPSFVWDAINRARYAKDDVQDTIDARREELANKRRHRRKIAAAKIVIQKDSLRTVERKLDRALDLYKFAHVIAYGRYNMLIYKRLTESSSAIAISTANHGPRVDSGDSASYAARQMVTMKAAKPVDNAIFEGRSILGRVSFSVYNQNYSFSIRTPYWFGERVYSTMIQRSIAGWQSTLSVYPIVHRFEDKLCDIIDRDDISTLLQYLREKNLTPLVHERDGSNLLHRAMLYESMEIIKWLLSCGLHPGSFSEWNPLVEDTPINLYVSEAQDWRFDIIKLCQDYMPDTIESCDPIWGHMATERCFYHFTAMKMALAPGYLTFDIRDRLSHALFGMMRRNWSWCEVKTLLPEAETLNRNLVANCDDSLRHARFLGVTAAVGIGRDLATLHSRKSASPVRCGFYPVLGDIVRLVSENTTSLCHNTDLDCLGFVAPLRPFLFGLLKRLDWHCPEVLDQILQSSILHWATLLYSSNVDLLHYGREVKDFYQILDQHISRTTINGDRQEQSTKRFPYTCSLLGITYGSLPTQWRLWWSPDDNDYAADFWKSVEDPEPEVSVFNVPGGWEDAFDGGDDDDADHKDNQKSSFIWSEYRKIRPPA